MANAIYISATGTGSGKSAVALGLLDMALRRTTRVGFFRPIIHDLPDGKRDEDIELVRHFCRLSQSYEMSYAWTRHQVNELIGANQLDAVLEKIIESYKTIEAGCDVVLIEGTDFLGPLSALEFDLNCLVARNLSASVLIVTNADDQPVSEVMTALLLEIDAFEDKGCHVGGVVLNKACPERAGELAKLIGGNPRTADLLIGLFPNLPSLLYPRVREIVDYLGAEVLFGWNRLDEPVANYLVAAMHLPNIFHWFKEDQLILMPGDRSDLLLAALEVDRSINYPRLAGVLLTAGLRPDSAMMRLIEGSFESLPVLVTPLDTFTAATRLQKVHASISAEDQSKIQAVLSLFERLADRSRLERLFSEVRPGGLTPRLFTYNLQQRARSNPRHIVLPEGEESRILKATAELLAHGLVKITLLGRKATIVDKLQREGISLDLSEVGIIDPATSPLLDDYAATYHALRQHKGVTLDAARDCLQDPSYFGTMMVYRGDADGMVSGAVHTTQHTIRPALQIIKTCPGCSLVSSVFFMCLDDGVVVYGDCAVNPDPTPEQLAEIAISSADTAAAFGLAPKVAFLSYSTGESGAGEEVIKVREGVRIAHERRPDIQLEGPIQYDAAVDEGVAALKMPGSAVAGHANVFVFPDLNTGNNTYKAVQRETGAMAIGPILQGLRKPVNDLSRGCTVDDIVRTVIMTAIQAQYGRTGECPAMVAPTGG